MEYLGFGLALIGFLLSAGVWIRSSKMQEDADAERKKLESKLSRSETRNKQVEAKAQAMDTRARELEKDLAEAVARRDEKAMASAMWALELERSYRQWRDVIVPDPSSSRPYEATVGQQLSFAISQEVERLREEVGVSISYQGDLMVELESETALGALRISEELLALAAKSADEVTVTLETATDDGRSIIAVNVDCIGWEPDNDPTTTELNTSVQSMANKLDGSVHWSRGLEDHLMVSVQLPVDVNEVDVSDPEDHSTDDAPAPEPQPS